MRESIIKSCTSNADARRRNRGRKPRFRVGIPCWWKDLARRACALSLLILAIPAAVLGEPVDSAPLPQSWDDGSRCGVNTVYVYARLKGVNLTYDSVLTDVAVDEHGSTMEDLRAFLSANGVPSVVVQATPGELDSLSLPVVAHVELDLTSEIDSAARGHFVVLVSVDPTHVSYIDGTTGQLLTESRDHFCRVWTGYLLAERKSFLQVLFRRDVFFVGVIIAGYLGAPLILNALRRAPVKGDVQKIPGSNDVAIIDCSTTQPLSRQAAE